LKISKGKSEVSNLRSSDNRMTEGKKTKNQYINGFTITKNNQGIADAFGSLTGEYETATAIVIENVTVNDTISIHTRRAMKIFNSYESCLDFITCGCALVIGLYELLGNPTT
jgi:hypothetical protein